MSNRSGEHDDVLSERLVGVTEASVHVADSVVRLGDRRETHSVPVPFMCPCVCVCPYVCYLVAEVQLVSVFHQSAPEAEAQLALQEPDGAVDEGGRNSDQEPLGELQHEGLGVLLHDAPDDHTWGSMEQMSNTRIYIYVHINMFACGCV